MIGRRSNSGGRMSVREARVRGYRVLSPFAAGALAVAIIAVGSYWAYTKANPFAGPYRLSGVFEDAREIKRRAAVRIAGVNVGKVTEVKPVGDRGHALLGMEIDRSALPIKRDADLKIRQRIFLEGNYFVDIHPGSPSAPELPEGSTVPVNQTASPVQFGEFLTALQRDTRADLRTFLDEYSRSLEEGGSEGFNEAVRYWEAAWRDTSLVNDATLGTKRGDLQRVLKGQGRAFGALARDEEALRELVTNLARTFTAFAREEESIQRAIPQLRDVLAVGRPALRSLNRGLPSLRAFARDALPGARSSSPTLDAQLPFLRQARRLVSGAELGGLVRDLRDTVPSLAKLNRSQARSFAESRALASCQNNVLLPFAKAPIPDPDFPKNSGQPWYKQAPRALVALSGESRIADANSPMFRVQGGGGPQTIVNTGETGEQILGQALFPIEGVRPMKPSKRPVFRPGVPCETQEPPNLNALSGPGDTSVVAAARRSTPEVRERDRRAKSDYVKLLDHLERVRKGLPSVDPLDYNERGERIQLRRLGLERGLDGKIAVGEPRGGGER